LYNKGRGETYCFSVCGLAKMLGCSGVLAGADSDVLALPDVDVAGDLEPSVKSHGHRASAVMVNVVSRQFENVLVEQNHCHGLKIVIRSLER
jgi:hypothetical protein